MTERFGMKPEQRLSALDDRKWVCTTPHRGLVRTPQRKVLEVLAVDAQRAEAGLAELGVSNLNSWAYLLKTPSS
jgi:hypothetical protein